jgi:hypothetical protein
MLSNWRNPPRPVAKSAEQGSRITGNTGKSVDGERDSAGPVVARKRVTPVEPRDPAVCSGSNDMGGKGEMINTPVSLQDLRKSLYVKAKAEPTWRFWGLYVHVCKMETLREAYQMAKSNDGAPGIDGVTFEAIEESGAESFLTQIRDELVTHKYRPMRARKKEIPKDGGKKVRVLSIPTVIS